VSRIVPALMNALRDGNHRVCSEGIEYLRCFGPEAKEAIPAIIAALDARPVQTSAVVAVLNFGPPAKDAVPALIKMLKEDGRNKEIIVSALGAIGPAAKEAVPLLLETRQKHLASDI
jgi:HEAT repeat protein